MYWGNVPKMRIYNGKVFIALKINNLIGVTLSKKENVQFSRNDMVTPFTKYIIVVFLFLI
ncbi:hypothetical protein COL60_21040 [Bacillus pseudomycoides]|uniref:Uncharacterized protein n=1 Tax=Bacillus pseudomycoides TaxID=64104 RepID=A0A2B6RC98_9BACI|nr:hypothetical protein CON79_24400 [Bacillus pseudomycoides]PEA82319.1 hypothetical protein CON99_17790 [Bacillus pseudomycoides]PED71263.1 hypothetical protein CON97_15015 [Bacillus pseudomycoides]PEI32198.1 hypothetical protein CN620_28535 [Bacillus pseudomycoides]PEJ72886.1 hypothetical protein CN680_21335 [Bacillus pseudomycoides]